MSMDNACPIETVIPELKTVLESQSYAVVQAPPGAGKTTVLPLKLLDEPWLSGQKIVILEPRRLAAKTAAGRMADLLEEPVGQRVGFQIRMEKNLSGKTRIEVITEGIFIRRIQQDPSLAGTGLVIFDEFHERSLNSDLGLALCLETCQVFREDLRILVMSATLDTGSISGLLDNCRVIESEGRAWPVKTRYADQKTFRGYPVDRVEHRCCRAVLGALATETGDVLVFLPGAGEIRRTAELLARNPLPESCSILPLFGNLTAKEQHLAIAPSSPGKRKVVLATSIAETSITIEGVRIVIDAGLARLPRFNPGSGMTRLETLQASIAATDQRRGRAGRTAPGICYRLWTKAEQGQRQAFTPPEILNADLSSLALELAHWGVMDPLALKWLDPPPKGAFSQARQMLQGLGCLDDSGRITAHGQTIVSMGLHPRLGHMVLLGKQNHQGRLACLLAAMLEEQDLLAGSVHQKNADIGIRVEAVINRLHLSGGTAIVSGIHHGVLNRVIKRFHKLVKALEIKAGAMDPEDAGRLLAFAFPERIASLRVGRHGEFLMASGSGAWLPVVDPLAGESWIVAVDLDGKPDHARIFIGASYSLEDLEHDFRQQFKPLSRISWEPKARCVIAVQETYYAKILLEEKPLKSVSEDRLTDAMVKGIQQEGLLLLPWTKILKQFQARAIFLKCAVPEKEFPDFSDAALRSDLMGWLGPFLAGVTTESALKRIDLSNALKARLTWDQQQRLDREAPTHLTVPSGTRIALNYLSENGSVLESPVLPVRLQEMFGLTRTPTIAGGSVKVMLHLLSPAGRPVQVTQDLESFWKKTYNDVKKDLKGRYPKHYWPDDPLAAIPTNRTKKSLNLK